MEKLLQRLWPHPRTVKVTGKFGTPKTIALQGKTTQAREEDIRQIWKSENCPRLPEKGGSSTGKVYSVSLATGAPNVEPEGYRISMNGSGAKILAATEAGLAYGFETLLQIGMLCAGGEWPEAEISDAPAYRTRAFMVDMGRSVYPPALLKRVVRILARLKMNQLHLHLFDDELCGIRFRGVPYGSENPFAITLDDFADLVRYAKGYNVEIMPELEAWGHVSCLAWHRRELAGGPGKYSGCSFKVGEPAFAVIKELVSQVAEVMPERGTIHFGLDEALWYTDSSLPAGFTPSDLVQRYYDILKEIGREQRKQFTMQLWADQSGRPVPEKIQKEVIIEPWEYFGAYGRIMIDIAVGQYGRGKMRWMAGAGNCTGRGGFRASRYWAKRSQHTPNCDGIDVCYWGTNDIERRFLSLFSGAYYAWNPASPTEFADEEDGELYDKAVFPIMGRWMTAFRDAYPTEIEKDRGPVISGGRHGWGPRQGEAIAPTVEYSEGWDRMVGRALA